MTKEGIDYNFKRLALFLNYHEAPIMGTRGVKEFLNGYAMIMDLMGSGNNQHSLLILSKIDFEEFKREVFKYPGFSQFPKSDTMTFEYDHYTWFVKPIFEYPIIEIKKTHDEQNMPHLQ